MMPGVLRVLARGQRNAESLMVSRGTCVRLTEVVDPFDGTTTVTESVVYEGRCKVQSFRPHETVVISGGRPVVVQRTEVHVPVGAGPFQVGDVWTVDGFRYPFRVAGIDEKSLQTAQHLMVDEVTNP